MPSGEVSSMSERVVDLSRMSAEELAVVGERALAYYQAHFTKERCMVFLGGVRGGTRWNRSFFDVFVVSRR